MLKHAGHNFPYFNYDEKSKRSDRIKNNETVRKLGVASKLTEIKSDTKAGRDNGTQAWPDMSVCQVIF